MMLVRAMMVAASATYLGRAATIAVRYCATRQQFRNTPGSLQETQVIDYPQVNDTTKATQIKACHLNHIISIVPVTRRRLHYSVDVRDPLY